MATMNVHPAAAVFPMLADDELDEMAADIKTSGLQQPIVRMPDGAILDGRNRLVACERAAVEPDFVTYDGDDPVGYLLSANVARRHLSTGQRAMATAVVLEQAGRRQNGRWRRGSIPDSDISGSAGNWTRRMAEAGVVLDHAPELVDGVLAGMPLDRAYRAAAERKQLTEEIEALADEPVVDVGPAPDLPSPSTDDGPSLSESSTEELRKQHEFISDLVATKQRLQALADDVPVDGTELSTTWAKAVNAALSGVLGAAYKIAEIVNEQPTLRSVK